LPAESSTKEVFDECYRAHRTAVFHWSLRYGAGNAQWAEDLTHDVFLKLFAALPGLGRHEDLGGWLYRVTANLAISRLRHERTLVGTLRELVGRGEPRAAAPDEQLESRQLAGAALRVLGALPAREKVVMTMKLLDDKSQREIAQALSMSEGYVSKLVTRATARLQAAGWEV